MDEQATQAATMALAQWLATGGRQGEAPDWWDTMQAARYLGVAPWEADPHSTAPRKLWIRRALMAIAAENIARQLQQAAAVQAQRQGAKLLVPAT